MVDRLLKTVALVLVALAGTVWAVGTVGFRTANGRELVSRFGVALLSDAVRGTVRVDSVGGSLASGMEIHHLRVYDEGGELLALVPRATVRYRLRDLLSLRIVLGQVILDDPFINLVKRPDGQFNYQEVLGLGGPPGGRPGPLIAFRDAEVRRGEIVVRTLTEPPPPDEAWDTEPHRFGLMRIRRMHDLGLRAPYVRIASPFPAENGVLLDLEQLEVWFTDPAWEILGAHGRLEVDGDSMRLDLEELRLPGSVARVRGTMRWPNGEILLGLDLDASRAAMNDLRGFAPRLPWGMAGRGRFALRSLSADSLVIEGDPMELTAPRGGGRIAGRLATLVSPAGVERMDSTDLSFEDLDLEYVRPMLDTVPFAGRLTGHVRANGPMTLLGVDLDWEFRDSLVAGWPTSLVRGSGLIAFGVPGDIVFQNFGLSSADVDLATMQRMFPYIALRGRFGGAGRLNGQWTDARFAGTLWHREDTLPLTRAAGLLRLDTRREYTGVWADLTLDSLQLAGVQPSYPLLPPSGAFAGRLELAGYSDSMRLDTDLSGPAGRIALGGDLTIVPEVIDVRNLEASLIELDAAPLYPGVVPTSLTGRIGASLRLDSLEPMRLAVTYRFDEPSVGGWLLDSVAGRLAVADSLFETDGAAWGRAARVTASGAFGLGSERTGTMTLGAWTDSLGVMEPFFKSLAPGLADESVLDTLVGTASAEVVFAGRRDDYAVSLDARIPHAASAGAWVDSARLTAGWESSFAEGLTIDAEADSVLIRGLAASFVQLRVSGPRRASRWMARSRFGLDGSWIGWGNSYADGRVVVLAPDSVRMLLPSQTWSLSQGALVSVSDSGFLFRNFVMDGDRTDARVWVEGLFPTNGSATLEGRIDSLELKDLWAIGQRDIASVDGMVSASFEVGGTAPAPVIHSTVTVAGGRFGAVQVPDLVGTLDYEDRRLVGDYEVRREDQLVTDLLFDLPLDLALQPVPERRLPGPVTVRARADSISLAFIELLTPNAQDASGTFDADFGVTGTWETPELTGRLSITDGTARFPRIGVTHHSGNGAVHLSGDSILIDSLSVASGAGLVSVAGFVRLEALRQPRLNLQIVGDRFAMIDVPDFMTLTTSGDVQLRGPVFGATLTGNGTITSGIVYFEDLVEKRIINLEDTLYSQLLDPSFVLVEGLRPDELQRLVRGDFENRFLDSVRIVDMQLEMGSQVWLRSGEANIQMLGQVSVNKTADVYRLDGVLNTPRGTYRLPILGSREIGPVREFTVTGGEVRYFGTTDWDAALDIDAQHVVRSLRRDNVTVFVNIGGTLYNPRLTLTSDVQPAISETEIISYLLFGAPSFEALTTVGAEGRRGQLEWGSFMMAQAGGVVSGELQQYLISDLGVPIDYFQISPTRADISATVGWQPHPRVFLTVSPRFCPSSDEHRGDFGFSMEYRFSRAWLASVSNDPVQPCGLQGGRFRGTGVRYQLGVDVFWERRY